MTCQVFLHVSSHSTGSICKRTSHFFITAQRGVREKNTELDEKDNIPHDNATAHSADTVKNNFQCWGGMC